MADRPPPPACPRQASWLWGGGLGLGLSPVWAAGSASSAPAALIDVLPGMALALALLALAHRWERRLLLSALAIVLWHLLSLELPLGRLSPSQASALQGLMLSLTASAVALLGLREAGQRQPGLEALLMGQALLLPLPPLLGWSGPVVQMAPWCLLAMQLCGVAAGLLWLRPRPVDAGWAAWWMHGRQVGLPALLCLSLGLDVLHGAWPQSSPFWAHAAGLTSLLMLVQGLSLLLTYAQTRNQLEQELVRQERHLRERIADVERHHQQLAEQRLDQVTERERKRIAGDLHDDLGAKLLTIVHTSESERISTLAREALEEMRLSVRGLTGKPVHLMDAIGDWRAEAVLRLGQANIEADWLPLDDDLEHTLPSRTYVQTTRILREAVSNIIKHSEASRCVVRCAVGEGHFQIIIQDNGRGIPSADGRLDRGHGMASMKSRAKQMLGQCLVESSPGWGTVIRLTLPL
ncbi:MAG: sensor histidine kinase [Inhella sp.]|uniref:sensor histidine kinase n=1 Tax=Inhella sp. TaxID=1921806 RepID=UPI0022CB77CC|nr:ATP-binding protein [Inhella sp.]MCZ8235199.1 ATP-binding protein [Inhella sp.]